EGEQLLAALGLADDQALVLQQLEGGVDRAGAGLPRPAAAFGDLLDHLVAVHRAVLQQGQNRRADVTAPCPSPRPAASSAAPGAAVTESGPPGAAGPSRTAGAEGTEGRAQALE